MYALIMIRTEHFCVSPFVRGIAVFTSVITGWKNVLSTIDLHGYRMCTHMGWAYKVVRSGTSSFYNNADSAYYNGRCYQALSLLILEEQHLEMRLNWRDKNIKEDKRMGRHQFMLFFKAKITLFSIVDVHAWLLHTLSILDIMLLKHTNISCTPS